jgi:DNA-binding PadR family transcriptional regulator
MKLFDGGIEEIILQAALIKPGISTEDLIKRVAQKRGGVTKQGVYRVLRKLKKEGKVVVYRSSASINALWLERLRSAISGQTGRSLFGDLGVMKEGERIVIEGKSLAGTDDLWSEAFINVENKTGTKHPLYLYNPHNWTILLRPETDELHIDRLGTKGRQVFLSIGGRTALDRETVRITSRTKVHCSISSTLRTADYIAVLGDHIFLIKLSRKGKNLMDDIFRKNILTEKAMREIGEVSSRISAKIFIERDAKKARVLKKKIARDFFIPKQTKDF